MNPNIWYKISKLQSECLYVYIRQAKGRLNSATTESEREAKPSHHIISAILNDAADAAFVLNDTNKLETAKNFHRVMGQM